MTNRNNSGLRLWLALVVSLFVCVCFAPAQDSAVSTTPPGSVDLVSALIPVIVPLVIAGIKLGLPRLPVWTLPFIAPLLGALVGLVATLTTTHSQNPWISAVLGLAGVGLREAVDQVKQQVKPPAGDP